MTAKQAGQGEEKAEKKSGERSILPSGEETKCRRYRLHKSLSQEETLKDQFNHALSTYEEALKNRESVASITQQQNEELATQLEQALTQQANMELQLQCAVEVSQAANEKVQKTSSTILNRNVPCIPDWIPVVMRPLSNDGWRLIRRSKTGS
ncbi:hypothetical protein STEG23_024185 [Scotinomys teguina]